MDAHREGLRLVAVPLHGNEAIGLHLLNVRTRRRVDDHAAPAADEAHNGIAGHGVAAVGDADHHVVHAAHGDAARLGRRRRALLLALAVGDDRIHGIGRFKDFRRRNNGLQTLHHLLGRETRVPDGGHQLVH